MPKQANAKIRRQSNMDIAVATAEERHYASNSAANFTTRVARFHPCCLAGIKDGWRAHTDSSPSHALLACDCCCMSLQLGQRTTTAGTGRTIRVLTKELMDPATRGCHGRRS
eukprot:6130174-Amphidinium_carterae.1